MPGFRGLGKEAEDRAAAYLLEAGYTLVTRRYSTRNGEIDLIVLDDETLVFVEVRLRRGKDRSPEESIGPVKAARVARAARAYLREMDQTERSVRFDVVAIDDEGIRHHVDAFQP